MSHIDELRDAIHKLHGAKATHRESVARPVAFFCEHRVKLPPKPCFRVPMIFARPGHRQFLASMSKIDISVHLIHGLALQYVSITDRKLLAQQAPGRSAGILPAGSRRSLQ